MTGYNRGDSASQKVDIGYWLSTDWTGKGLVSKTTKALIDFAFNETDVQKVYIKCATSNLRSQGIPRRLRLHKLEQSKDSCHDDGQLIPAQVYYIGREEWLERN